MSDETENTGYEDYLLSVAYHDGINKGIASCAAGPWTYRTDTGDATGKVVETAELPKLEKNIPLLILTKEKNYGTEYGILYYDELDIVEPGYHWSVDLIMVSEDWLREHLIAYAEINEVRK